MTKHNQYPKDDANPHWPGNEWSPSSRRCPQCGAMIWEAKWFDDPEEDGGSCIGMKYACGDCDFTDSH